MTTAVDKWPASARLMAVATADHLSKLLHHSVGHDQLLDFDGEVFPSDGCAITLSILLQEAGISVPDTFRAIDLGNVLKNKNWKTIAVGDQQAGDIGSTCGSQPHHGQDH